MNKSEILKELIAAEKSDPTKVITCPADVFPLLAKYADDNVETMRAISLNGANKIKKVRKVSVGLLNRCLIHPRETFVGAIQDRAASIILVHNHPSGNLEPSQEDIEVCERIRAAGVIIGIELRDNLIISKEGYYSFLEEGKL